MSADDDLSAPLGQSPPGKPRVRLPVRPSHGVAGILGFALMIFGGWALLADDPFGGEPMVIVSADARGPAPALKGGEPDKPIATPAPPPDRPLQQTRRPTPPARPRRQITPAAPRPGPRSTSSTA